MALRAAADRAAAARGRSRIGERGGDRGERDSDGGDAFLNRLALAEANDEASIAEVRGSAMVEARGAPLDPRLASTLAHRMLRRACSRGSPTKMHSRSGTLSESVPPGAAPASPTRRSIRGLLQRTTSDGEPSTPTAPAATTPSRWQRWSGALGGSASSLSPPWRRSAMGRSSFSSPSSPPGRRSRFSGERVGRSPGCPSTAAAAARTARTRAAMGDS